MDVKNFAKIALPTMVRTSAIPRTRCILRGEVIASDVKELIAFEHGRKDPCRTGGGDRPQWRSRRRFTIWFGFAAAILGKRPTVGFRDLSTAIMIGVCVAGCATAREQLSSSKTISAEGSLRTAGTVVEGGYPCDVLKESLNRRFENGLVRCDSVKLDFLDNNGRNLRPVYDLWLVTIGESFNSGPVNVVADFYESATLGNIDQRKCGRFDFERYSIFGKDIYILIRQSKEAMCPQG